MVMQIRPLRGGFLRPFGCGWFIREFLLGHGPEGSTKIDPNIGAVQENIEESRARTGLEPYEAPRRKYYRLTKEGIEAPDYAWSNPLIACHPEIAGMRALDYFRDKRKGRIYVQKRPTKRRPKS